MRNIGFLVLACLAVPLSALAAPDHAATAYQVTPSHNASAHFSKTWGPQLKVLWTAALDGAASFPLVAKGFVYALVQGTPNEIVAINETTGAVAWKASAGSGSSLGLAYDEGRIFSVNQSGTLSAYSARRGGLQWSEQLPGQYSFSSAPSALNGIVYVGGAGSGGTLYAVEDTTGKLLWTQSVQNGDDSSPAVTETGVYVSYPCQYYDFDPKSGAPIWYVSTGCEGGGGNTVVVGAGLAFVRDWTGANTIFNATTGASVGSFGATAAPAVASKSLAFFLDGNTMSAVSPTSSKLYWEFTGDGSLYTPPLIVNSWVLAASGSGNIYVLNGLTGAVAYTTKLTGSMGQALGAGNGIVLVPVGSTLVALGSTT